MCVKLPQDILQLLLGPHWLPLQWNMPAGSFMTFECPSILTSIMFTVIQSSSTDLTSPCSSWKNKCWFICRMCKLTTSSSVYRVSTENFPLWSHSGSDPLCADLLVNNVLFVNDCCSHSLSSPFIHSFCFFHVWVMFSSLNQENSDVCNQCNSIQSVIHFSSILSNKTILFVVACWTVSQSSAAEVL